MRVTTLVDRLTVAVDPSADPVDVDEALAVFLLRYVRSQARTSDEPATVEAE